MNKILTIIVTYNGMKWLDQCLSSVKKSTIPSDLFIVDNGSTDGSIEYIKKNYPEAIFIESKENLGFGKANNIGLRQAAKNNYEYVYLLNQDAWIEPDTFEKLIKVSENNPDYGILSPLQVNKEKTRLDKNFSHWIPSSMSSDLCCDQELKDVYETKFTMAAHWFIPVDKLKVVGGFSPAFRHYGEDNNLIDRMRFRDYKIGIVPDTMGVHDREDRSLSKEKKQYLSYVLTIAMLNNPTTRFRFIKLLKRIISETFHPSDFNLRFALRSFRDYIKSIKFRKQYMENGPFL